MELFPFFGTVGFEFFPESPRLEVFRNQPSDAGPSPKFRVPGSLQPWCPHLQQTVWALGKMVQLEAWETS